MATLRFFIFVFCLTGLFPAQSLGNQDSIPHHSLLEKLAHLEFEVHGAMNYYHFNWQTDSARRNAIDNELFTLEMNYHWTPKVSLTAEIEFEHGGTGSSLEFDRFEEFGEFEYDISKGGEVLLEELSLTMLLNDHLELEVGRLRVPFGASYHHSDPTDYYTATYSEMEAQILPRSWTENGLMLHGSIGSNRKLSYDVGIINGLDGTAFNSANWIKRGHQQRFELINAENFAFAGRLDFQPNENFMAGISLYGGNTSGNRPKPDLKVDAPLGIGDFHIRFRKPWASFNGMFFYGALGNSEALTNQNRNLSNNLNVKRTPVAASALGAFAEIAVPVIRSRDVETTGEQYDKLTAYLRGDYYDTMHSTQGEVFNNPRWERFSTTFGVVYKIIPDVQFKGQYTLREVGAPAPISVDGGTQEHTIILGFAFEL
jgi:hypothetical protein